MTHDIQADRRAMLREEAADDLSFMIHHATVARDLLHGGDDDAGARHQLRQVVAYLKSASKNMADIAAVQEKEATHA